MNLVRNMAHSKVGYTREEEKKIEKHEITDKVEIMSERQTNAL